MALLEQVLWFVKPLLAVYGFVCQKMYGVVALAQASVYCCSQLSKFYTILDAKGSTHSCPCWSVVSRKIDSVMSSSCFYVCGRARLCVCVCGFLTFQLFKELTDLRRHFGVSTEGQPSALFIFIFFFCALAKLRKTTVSFVMSVRLSARLLVCPSSCNNLADRFSWNLIFEYFSKICQRNSSLVKIWQE